MTDEDLTLPAALAEAHDIGFFEDHDGYDLQPEETFLWSGEVTEWWRQWTGNASAEPPPLRVFGADGTGGLAAFWVREPAAALETQPLVFVGSEGEMHVIAKDLGDYLWLLAAGVGPLEPIEGIRSDPEPVPALVAVARRHSGLETRPVEAVLAAARAEHPALVEELTRCGGAS
ncbi:hypothetical protein [Actinoplanes friuliensis]|uniref:SMI1/KNR4 family protein n=1 Tax=Actinoplanes friuliensis DSM 7358 TaxID=1246995 RepID=U5W1X1_9ACTN|nr:hypothetical protein [Actinoplanes friuliensis]AGZ43022.1 hypothetical protein AFR_23770 [Actinoplanes friuliensis DSM 7358]